jgi:hypothetical protein
MVAAACAYTFNQLPVLDQRVLVFDIVVPQPRFDLISESLQLFDLRLEIILDLVPLRRVRSMIEFGERRIERLYT